MTIETVLTELVKIYAKYESDKNCYVSQLDNSALLRLDADFSQLINSQLLVDGPELDKIKKNYNRLTLYFHTDRSLQFLPEVKWIEQNLSQGRNDGICFKILTNCFEKFKNPQQFKEINFEGINSREDCRIWLEHLKDKAGSYTARSFWESLIGLLDESGGFYDEVGKIKPKGLKTLLTFMPIIFASYGTIILAQELFAVYALYFVMLKSGQYLERSDLSEVKHLGITLQKLSIVTATATTTLMVRLLEMTFWISHQCLDASLQIGSAIFKPLLSEVPKGYKPQEDNSNVNLCTDLILASQNLNAGIQYKTPELKVVSAPLEAYLGLNTQQFFGDWRIGKEKRLLVEACLFRMRVFDSGTDSTADKLIATQKELEKLKENKDVYAKGSKTAAAVDIAEQALTFLTEPDCASMQLAVYNNSH